MTDLLMIKGLNASYTKNSVLSNITFTLREHEVVGLIGLNGAGKTTLLHSLAGVHENFELNQFIYLNQSSHPMSMDFKKERYIVFAEDHSFGFFTFNEYIRYIHKVYGKSLSNQLLDHFIQGFQFEKYTNQYIGELSTGNKRKVFLITAFVLEPKLLLLDEPTNGLDFQSIEFLYESIKSYKQKGTILFSSHIAESMSLTCDRLLILKNGSIYSELQKPFDADSIRKVIQ